MTCSIGVKKHEFYEGIMKINRLNQATRRNFIKRSLVLSAISVTGIAGFSVPAISFSASLTREERNKMTPDAVIEHFRQGNLRFRTNNPVSHDYLAQKRSSASGQFPAAVILSCIDSRAPAEILLDAGIGETFNARIAGNISNNDILGSMEFACAVAGAKLVLVMGHTDCGAVKGAIDNAELGHLTELLDQIKPAIHKTEYTGERSGSNYDFVNAVARENVKLAVENIRNKSSVLKDLEDKSKIKIIGGMYSIESGDVDFFDV